jgi:hypothetical protein
VREHIALNTPLTVRLFVRVAHSDDDDDEIPTRALFFFLLRSGAGN